MTSMKWKGYVGAWDTGNHSVESSSPHAREGRKKRVKKGCECRSTKDVQTSIKLRLKSVVNPQTVMALEEVENYSLSLRTLSSSITKMRSHITPSFRMLKNK